MLSMSYRLSLHIRVCTYTHIPFFLAMTGLLPHGGSQAVRKYKQNIIDHVHSALQEEEKREKKEEGKKKYVPCTINKKI